MTATPRRTPGDREPLSRSWQRALAEHDAAVAAFDDAASAIAEEQWQVPRAPGKWSPAEEVLHVVLAYEVGLRGVRTGAGMRARVSPSHARLLRWLILPVVVNTSWFPRAKAPVEVRPVHTGDVDLAPAALMRRLRDRARDVRDEMPRAPSELRVQHAYFGDLAPRQAMRMLAAHTRHHARTVGVREK